MRLHRFYTGTIHDKWGAFELKREVWVHDARLLKQWIKVLRYKVGNELVLFNDESERIYRIIKIEQPHSVGLELVTELERTLPEKHIYLLWSLLKKDKNDWVLQKATEIGVRNFVPLVAARSEKAGFDAERAKKIVIEAAEQCGRSDIPQIREPITVNEAVNEYTDLPLLVCQQSQESYKQLGNEVKTVGVVVGPEGGWSDEEISLFESKKLGYINIAQFTLRAETAAITAVGKLLQ